MSSTSTLDDIGLRHGTDKASDHHDYLTFYEMFFAPLRQEPVSILEIGVLGGASLRTWREYFPHAAIVGADINPNAKRYESERIAIELLDQSNIEELTRLAVKHGPFDIVIEDGSHLWEHQITTLRTLFPFVKDGGLYIVEDLQTNYGSMEANFRGVDSISCVEYLKSLVDLRVADNQIDIDKTEDAFLRTYGRKTQLITFTRRACLLKKQFPPGARARASGTPLVVRPASRHWVAVRLVAHVANTGDVLGMSGFVNLGPDRFSIQGFLIDTDDKLLEYRVLQQGESIWSEWHRNDEFAGVRGQSKALIGCAIRLRKPIADRYSMRIFARFAGSTEPLEVENGEDCLSASGKPLCGLQIDLTEPARQS